MFETRLEPETSPKVSARKAPRIGIRAPVFFRPSDFGLLLGNGRSEPQPGEIQVIHGRIVMAMVIGGETCDGALVLPFVPLDVPVTEGQYTPAVM